jgi:hypothetical protein
MTKMRKYLVLSSLLIAAGALHAQSGIPTFQYANSALSGSCSGTPPIQIVFSTGAFYGCVSGTWTLLNAAGSTGFPIIIGSTSIGADSTTTEVTGLSVNGVTLSTAGPNTNFLNESGTYSAPTGGGSPSGPAFSIQAANSGATGFTSDSAILLNTTTHALEVGGAISGNAFTLTNLSAIPAPWTMDVTSPATVLASLGGAPVNAPDFTGGMTVDSPTGGNEGTGTVNVSSGYYVNGIGPMVITYGDPGQFTEYNGSSHYQIQANNQLSSINGNALTAANAGTFGSTNYYVLFSNTVTGSAGDAGPCALNNVWYNAITSAVSGCVSAPVSGSGTKITNGGIFSAYSQDSALEPVGLISNGYAYANGVKAYSYNNLVSDLAGLTSGVVLVGQECDIQPSNPTSAYTGGVCFRAVIPYTGSPSNTGLYPFDAFEISNNVAGTYWTNGINSYIGAFNSSGTVFNINANGTATSSSGNFNCPNLMNAYEAYWTGSANAFERWQLGCVVASGTNPSTDWFKVQHSGAPGGQISNFDLTGGIQLELDGATSGSAFLSVAATGGLLNLGSTNATVDTSGNMTVVSCTGCGGSGGSAFYQPYGGTTTGSVNVMAATISPAPANLAAMLGVPVSFLPNLANTTTTPTINFNSFGAETIVKCGSLALVSGDLSTTAVAVVIWNGTNMQLQNPQNTICQPAANGTFQATTFQISGGTFRASAITGTTTVEGGQQSTNSSQPGALILQGGPNTSTGNAGNVFVEAGAASGAGQQGILNTQQSFTIAAATTIGYTMAMTTTSDKVQPSPIGGFNNVGVAASVGGTTAQIYVVSSGKVLTVFDGTPVVGDVACYPPASTGTIGLAHDNGSTACTLGEALGIVTGQVSGTGSGATATVLIK